MPGFLIKTWGRVEESFFPEQGPFNLAVTRIAFYFSLLFLVSPEAASFGKLPSDFWLPIGPFRFFPEALASPVLIPSYLHIVWIISLVFSAVGFGGKPCLALSCGLSLFYFGYPNCFGVVVGSYGPIAIAQIVLTLSPCNDALSVDRWIRERFFPSKTPSQTPSWRYAWPLKLVQAFYALLWFEAGAQKLAISGLSWITSDQLEKLLRAIPNPTSQALAEYGTLCRILATSVILFEILFPLLLLTRGRTLALILSSAFMLINYHLLNVRFHIWLICVLFFVDWGLVRDWIRVQRMTFQGLLSPSR